MELITRYFSDDGSIPNSGLPVLIYKKFFKGAEAGRAESYEALLEVNHWGGSWRNGLFNYHHYHSTAHEVLCVYSGWVDARLGGESGETMHLEAGDVVILPAGTGHKNMGQGGLFKVIGSYPDRQSPDMNYGRPGERPASDSAIASVPLPDLDPMFGPQGGIGEYWRSL